MGCTTLLVGKKASYDGSTMMARNEDSGATKFSQKKFTVVTPDKQPRHYVSVISKVEIDLPDNPMRYTQVPSARESEGVWGEAGVNEKNVAMTETETITSNARVQGADPLVPGGIGEEDMLTVVLPYISSAREGVLRLGKLLEEYGTYEMNGIGFQDEDEVWWMETLGGHHWFAVRIPDECYAVIPNQQGIDFFDLVDAFGEKKNNLCSEDLIDFILDNHLDLTVRTGEDNAALLDDDEFDARAAFSGSTDSDHSYNTPRAWFMLRYFNPNTYKWDGEDAEFTPVSDDLPFCETPEKLITDTDVKYVLSSHYQGTPYDPYGKHGDDSLHGAFRPIGINRNCEMVLTQIRPYMPDELKAVQWVAFGSNAFNAMVPFYTNINKTPDYFAYTPEKPSTDSFYWANRLIGALADASFSTSGTVIERYQQTVARKSHELLNKYDREFKEGTDPVRFAEQANEAFSAMAREATDDALDKVLFNVTVGMKNAFSREDA
ncbi:MAG: C69 family dipeptidase [Eubacteriales bacterium]|nr:C69 family dipeptidase [Eubacteriales bacterium]